MAEPLYGGASGERSAHRNRGRQPAKCAFRPERLPGHPHRQDPADARERWPKRHSQESGGGGSVGSRRSDRRGISYGRGIRPSSLRWLWRNFLTGHHRLGVGKTRLYVRSGQVWVSSEELIDIWVLG